MDYVGCVGTEERCVASYSELKRLGTCRTPYLVEIIDPDSEYSAAAASKRTANRQKFIATGVPSSRITPLELLTNEENVVAWIESFLNSSDSLLLDISCIPKRFFFPAVKLLLNKSSISNLFVSYSLPDRYHSGNIAERPSDWRALPLFGPEKYPDPNYEVAIIGVGFLPFGLPDLLRSGFQKAKPHLFVPFPSSPSAFIRTWEFVRQIESSLALPDPEQLRRVNGMDPADTYDHICWLTDDGAKHALFAPYGPKPMSLAMAIYAAQAGAPVFYTQPRIYHPDYSIGTRERDGRPEVFLYCLRLNGRDVFDLTAHRT